MKDKFEEAVDRLINNLIWTRSMAIVALVLSIMNWIARFK